mgnify:CR=1 FL=1
MMLLLYILVGVAAAFLAGVWFLRNVWFHRDPAHVVDQADGTIRSPVYGRVAYIRQVSGGVVVSEKLGEEIRISDITKDDWPNAGSESSAVLPEAGNGDGWIIGVAMTPLDVHFQYAPIPGTMGKIVHHQHGRNLPMFDFWEYFRITWLRKHVQLWAKKYVFENERQTMWLQGARARIALILIADKFVSKISTFVKEGDSVESGGKLSFIARGSQVDVLICGQPDLEVLVREGDPANGPNTVLARIPAP